MMIEIVEASANDANVVARLHSLSWQASYAGILPDDYLKNEAARERAEYWSVALPAGDYSLVLLATDGPDPVGFIAVKDGADEGYDATIEHLHVLPKMKGIGLGRRLMQQTSELLLARGANSVCLWVFEDNRTAIGFYESLGGLTDAYGTDEFLGSDKPDRRIGWHDLSALHHASSPGNKP
ncbi:MAG: GNAT family N-acetyltransferase [Aestuariivirgaceae bacterium]